MGTEPSADTVQPIGRSKRTHFIVITLLGLAMGAFPGLFSLEFQLHVINYYINQDPASIQVLIPVMDFAIFLISPCLFFVLSYLFGKRTAQHFRENYLEVVLFLFLGSALGSGLYFVVQAFVGWGVPIIWSIVYEIMYIGFWGVFVGFTALALSHFRVGSLPTAPEQSLSV